MNEIRNNLCIKKKRHNVVPQRLLDSRQTIVVFDVENVAFDVENDVFDAKNAVFDVEKRRFQHRTYVFDVEQNVLDVENDVCNMLKDKQPSKVAKTFP